MRECTHHRFTFVQVEFLGESVEIYVNCNDCEASGKRIAYDSQFEQDYDWE